VLQVDTTPTSPAVPSSRRSSPVGYTPTSARSRRWGAELFGCLTDPAACGKVSPRARH
jgi:hypothetical protein